MLCNVYVMLYLLYNTERYVTLYNICFVFVTLYNMLCYIRCYVMLRYIICYVMCVI